MEDQRLVGGQVNIETLLVVIAVLLLLILWELIKIGRRLKDRLPTDKEQDYEWAQKDPAGHSEAHKEEE